MPILLGYVTSLGFAYFFTFILYTVGSVFLIGVIYFFLVTVMILFAYLAMNVDESAPAWIMSFVAFLVILALWGTAERRKFGLRVLDSAIGFV